MNWSRGKLVWLEGCCVCGSKKPPKAIYERRDDAGVMPDVWRVVRCAECHSLYLNPRPDSVSLPSAYADYYTHLQEPLETNSTGLIASLVNGYINYRFGMKRQPASAFGALLFSAIEPFRLKLNVFGRHLAKLKPDEQRTLLDVGCGNGTFIKRALEMGWKAQGCEPDETAITVCQANNLNVLLGDAFHPALDNQRFNTITMNHVIEHVFEPQALLQRIFDLLHPNGRAWIALPNPSALGLSLYGRGWKGLHLPFHLAIPSQQILLDWLRLAGFSDIRPVRRGAQSQKHWQESRAISLREGSKFSALRCGSTRLLGDIICTFSASLGEEFIVIATKH